MARIIVADDTAFIRMKLRQILEAAGHEVVADASDGDKAVIEYEKHMPDLITMDVTMPNTNGIEAVKRIIKKHPKAKIVIISAITQKKIIFDALVSGAKNYIIKPYTPEKVIEAINQVLGTDNRLPAGTGSRIDDTIDRICAAMDSINDTIDRIG